MRRPVGVLVAVLSLTAVTACGGDGRAQPASPPAQAPTRGPAATTTPATTAPAAPPAGRAPARRAPDDPYAVGERVLRLNRGGDRPLPVTVWYPATGASGGRPRTGAPAARGRFPLVVFSHGLGGTPVDYESLLVRWAAGGFVVAAPTYPNTSGRTTRPDVLDVLNQPADASYAVTKVLALDGTRNDPLRGRIDTTRVGAAGHSAGGITTIGLFTVDRDERLDAGVVLAGSSLGVGLGYTGSPAPQLFVHGSLDNVVSYASGKAAYDAVPWPKAMLTLPEGDHGRALRTAGDPTFEIVADTTLDFLRWSLYGDQRAKPRLPRNTAPTLATLDSRL